MFILYLVVFNGPDKKKKYKKLYVQTYTFHFNIIVVYSIRL